VAATAALSTAAAWIRTHRICRIRLGRASWANCTRILAGRLRAHAGAGSAIPLVSRSRRCRCATCCWSAFLRTVQLSSSNRLARITSAGARGHCDAAPGQQSCDAQKA